MSSDRSQHAADSRGPNTKTISLGGLWRMALALRRGLIADYRRAYAAVRSGSSAPADEWLANDFHAVEKQLALLLSALEDSKSIRLPGFKTPRVFCAAQQLVKLRSAVCTPEDAAARFAELQKSFTLTHDELCFIPTALKLALLEFMSGALSGAGRRGSQADETELDCRNALQSLASLDDARWDELIEDLSIPNSILLNREEFAALDRQSRSFCLEKIKRIAKSLKSDETQVARTAARLAADARELPQSHVGYYLAGQGENELRRAVRPAAPRLPLSSSKRLALFISGVFACTLLFMLPLFCFGAGAAALGLFPALFAAISLVSHIASRMVKPRNVLRAEPDEARFSQTAVAMPVLLTSADDAASALARLETHYLANRLPGVAFILLADLPDAQTRVCQGDKAIEEAAAKGIEELNNRHGERFFLLFRQRSAAPDGMYSGYERKRGAVMELCALLTGREARFCVTAPRSPGRRQYLALLDSDTVLPHGTLKKLIGAASLEINRAAVKNGRLVRGSSVFVPNMRTTSGSSANSFFARLFGGDNGAELYSASVANMHMDLYASGDFGGKGMVLTEPFYALLNNKLPPNTVLSHDLLEGSIAGAAFINDVTLYDETPSTLPKWHKRRERWIRGDWQLWPFIAGRQRKTLHGALPRVKMLGNILGSLREPITLAVLLLSALFGVPAAFCAAIISFLFEPVKCFVLLAIRSLKQKQHFAPAAMLLLRSLTEFLTLPYGAYSASCAIIKALWRMNVSRKNMLQWQTGASGSERTVGIVNAIGAALLVICSAVSFAAAKLSAPFTGALLLSAVWLTARPLVSTLDRKPAVFEPNERQKALLTEIFSGAWRFFKENCNEGNNFLPPDNIQYYPPKPPADRTSPTNIGMALLAYICAYDMGAIDGSELIRRVYNTASTINRLAKRNGCLYNWYNIKTLCPLEPRFVSSVDCGNLIAALMVAEDAMRSLKAFDAAALCKRLIDETQLETLYDSRRRLFYIGYDETNACFTPSHYDLYASEARILSFAAIALDRVPARHWQMLSRITRAASGGRVLLSWSGTAFEYLMPLIFFKTAPGSLQHEVCLSAVRTQILDSKPGAPWGVSECGYYCFDESMNYRYHAFGVHGLALEPERRSYRITAPYAAALALYSEPEFALDDLALLVSRGMMGETGMYEALDHTAGDETVKSSMAHHKGMELCACAAMLTGGGIADRFMSLGCVRAHEELLYEHFPIRPIRLRAYENSIFRKPRERTRPIPVRKVRASRGSAARRGSDEYALEPVDGQLLSNGGCFTHVFADGSSRSGILREGEIIEMTADNGVELLLWADGKPLRLFSDAEFAPHSARFKGGGAGVGTVCTVCAAANANAEIRTVSAINNTDSPVSMRFCVSYRPVLTHKSRYLSHPAFIRLMTEAERCGDCILFHLRQKDASGFDRGVWQYASVLFANGCSLGSDGFEAPGRAACGSNPQTGVPTFKKYPVEPFFSAVGEADIAPGEQSELTFILGAADSKSQALADLALLGRNTAGEQKLASAVTVGLMRRAGAEPEFAMLAEPLAARIAKGLPFKPRCDALADERYPGLGGKSALWRLGVSGDIPILLVECNGCEPKAYESLNKLLSFARFCRMRGLEFDTVIALGEPQRYGDGRQARLLRSAAETRGAHVFFDGVDDETLFALQTAALIRCTPETIPYPAFVRQIKKLPQAFIAQRITPPQLEEPNGYGGFYEEGREYVILHGGCPTPAPWCNIIAGRSLGFAVSERGGGFTWYKNSRLMRLTPWANDPLRDPVYEKVFIGEGQNALYLTPAHHGSITRHGPGFTSFRAAGGGLEAELTAFADADEPVKYYLVKIKNTGFLKRRLVLRLEVEWALGEAPSVPPVKRICGGRLEAGGAFNELGGNIAFIAGESADEHGVGYSFTLGEGAEAVKTFIMAVSPPARAQSVCAAHASPKAAQRALERVRSEWQKRLGTLVCHTADKHFDMLVNGRLLYQTYSSRLLARTGYYQNGGAAGFRDELQDVTALLLGEPERAKNAILSAAANQFKSGDVLHWRHENGFGVRTRISDDRLFLPYAAIEYALVTGDDAIWSRYAPYLKEEPIPEGKKDLYSHFAFEGGATLIEHCIAAIDSALALGPHGLPLMAGGDWNDGMDNVGLDGGESCFLGWLLVYVLERFRPFLQSMGFAAKAQTYEITAKKLRAALEKHAWAGDRYLRAFYADGTPLGAEGADACAIDAVAQCWPVFCGAEHKQEAFDSMLKLLADEQSGILRLLDPPFNGNGGHFAGYIENYVPGVRENGGQYTHAAVWALIAACRLGRGEDAQRLFELLDPIRKGSRENIERYKAEPYALAGDVYSGENAGRAGWTWYTGAAAWLYRAATEHMLGIKKRGERLYIEPVNGFDGFTAEYRFGGSVYAITAKKTGKRSLKLDGRPCEYVRLADDGARHGIEVTY